MKKTLTMFLIGILTFTFCACDDGSKAIEAAFNNAISQAESLVSSGKMEEAYNLLGDAELLELTEEQLSQVKSHRNAILKMCFPGTFVVKPEMVTKVSVKRGNEPPSGFYVKDLIENTFGGVWFTYEFETISEKKLVAEQYRDVLEQQYEFLDISVKNGATHYNYADEMGNSLFVTVYDDDKTYTKCCFNVGFEQAFYHFDLLDTTNQNKDLLDTTILVLE